MPTGNVIDYMEVDGLGTVECAIVDMMNPFVFVHASTVGATGTENRMEIEGSDIINKCVAVRSAAAVKLGFVENAEDATELSPSRPSIAFVAKRTSCVDYATGETINEEDFDFLARNIFNNTAHDTLLGCADEKEVIKGLPWSIMLLIGGVSILITVVSAGGGITYLSDLLSGGITGGTAAGIMAILGGLMSSVSSSVGVVMPTLIPIAGELSNSLGVSVSALVAGIVVGANSVVVSPLSTVGGISMASLPESIDKNSFFKKLLFAAVLYTLSGALLGFLGIYGWIVG